MNIPREEHARFLDLELKKQTDQYIKLIQQTALSLLEKEELFTSQFVKLEDGELILKFKLGRPLPRKNDYFTAVILVDEKRSFKSWGNITWCDLREKYQAAFTELICIWHQRTNDGDAILAGFRGASLQFAEKLIDKCLVTLGPKEPPLKYLQNLINVVRYTPSESKASQYLDLEIVNNIWAPALLRGKGDYSEFLLGQLSITDNLIIQGPPGTGKTYLMASLVSKLLSLGKTVLVTSLTNRALIELASKPQLKEALKAGKVFKSNLTSDELHELPGLQNSEEVTCSPGALSLATFYVTSGCNAHSQQTTFDYVIMDEASQALLAMFAAATRLGNKLVFIGDPVQLSPVVLVPDETIKKKGAINMVEGFTAICKNISIPSFQLSETYRLPPRATSYTGTFYKGNLVSVSREDRRFHFPELGDLFNSYLHPSGGPVLLKTHLPVGEDTPDIGIQLIIDFLGQLLNQQEKGLNIAVVSKLKKTVKGLQKAITGTIGTKKNLLVDTVDRIQGLTCDVTIFFIPNSRTNLSLQRSLFNVATSRAKRHTIIVADATIVDYPLADKNVMQFLKRLDKEFSFIVIPQTPNRTLHAHIGNEDNID